MNSKDWREIRDLKKQEPLKKLLRQKDKDNLNSIESREKKRPKGSDLREKLPSPSMRRELNKKDLKENRDLNKQDKKLLNFKRNEKKNWNFIDLREKRKWKRLDLLKKLLV